MTIDLKDLRAKQQGISKLPWELWTSCSWRRFSNYRGEGVIVPFTSRADGHPDLIITDADAAYIVAACNALPELLDMVEDAEYRYECLKSLYEDEMNYSATGDQAEQDVDDFIAEEQSHS